LYWNKRPGCIQTSLSVDRKGMRETTRGNTRRGDTCVSASRGRGMEIDGRNCKTMLVTKGIERRLNFEWENERMEQVKETEC
jgi:hypothetical protein